MGIVIIPLMTIAMTVPGITNTLFNVNNAALDVSTLEDSMLKTHFQISGLTAGSGNQINFNLKNVGSTQLWDYEDFDFLVTYRGIVSGTPTNVTEKLTYNPSSPTGTPIAFISSAQTNGLCILGLNCSFTHNIAAGSNGILIVGINQRSGNGISSVTYNGQQLTKIRQDDNGQNAHTSLWYLKNPPTGSHSVTITVGLIDTITAGSMYFTGVDQSTPIDVHNGATGTSATPSVILTTTQYEDWIVDTVGSTTGPMTVKSAQTQRWQDVAGTTRGAGSSQFGSAYGTYSMGWTNNAGSQSWAISAVAIKPAAISCCVPVDGWNVKSISNDFMDPRVINPNETAAITGKTSRQIVAGGNLAITFSTDNGAKATSFVVPS